MDDVEGTQWTKDPLQLQCCQPTVLACRWCAPYCKSSGKCTELLPAPLLPLPTHLDLLPIQQADILPVRVCKTQWGRLLLAAEGAGVSARWGDGVRDAGDIAGQGCDLHVYGVTTATTELKVLRAALRKWHHRGQRAQLHRVYAIQLHPWVCTPLCCPVTAVPLVCAFPYLSQHPLADVLGWGRQGQQVDIHDPAHCHVLIAGAGEELVLHRWGHRRARQCHADRSLAHSLAWASNLASKHG
jgi:hypothetical protein